MGQARQVIVLADSSKAGKVSFASAGRWDNVHVLITDKQMDKDFAKELIKKGHQARPSLKQKRQRYEEITHLPERFAAEIRAV